MDVFELHFYLIVIYMPQKPLVQGLRHQDDTARETTSLEAPFLLLEYHKRIVWILSYVC